MILESLCEFHEIMEPYKDLCLGNGTLNCFTIVNIRHLSGTPVTEEWMTLCGETSIGHIWLMTSMRPYVTANLAQESDKTISRNESLEIFHQENLYILFQLILLDRRLSHNRVVSTCSWLPIDIPNWKSGSHVWNILNRRGYHIRRALRQKLCISTYSTH